MEAKLIVVGGKASKKAIALKLPTVIGRGREAGLTVVHPMISRRHCEIFESDGLLMVRDLGSLNGIVVGGQQVEEAPLRPGDEFTVGPLTFRAAYEYDGDLDSLPMTKTAEEEAPQPAVQSGGQISDVDALAETPNFAFLDAPVEEAADQEPDAVDLEEIVEVDEFDEEEDEEEEPEPTPPPSLPPRKKPVTEQAAAEPVEEATVSEVEQLEEEEEEEEPEPTPPPPPPRHKEPAAEQTSAEPAEEATVSEVGELEKEMPAADTEPVTDASQEQPNVDAWEEIQVEAAEELITGKADAPKKKGRWPFGRRQKKDRAPEPAEDAEPAPAAEKPAGKAPRPPSKKKGAAKSPKAVQSKDAEALPDFFTASPDASPSDTDDDLNEFLKGLK